MIKVVLLLFTILSLLSLLGMIGMKLVLSLIGVSNSHRYVIFVVVFIVLTMGYQKGGVYGDTGYMGHRNGTEASRDAIRGG